MVECSTPIEDEGYLKLFISFGIRGDRLDPDEITAALGVRPAWTHRKGEEYVSRDGRKMTRPSTVWGVKTELSVQSKDLNDHAKHLLELLEPRRAAIQLMRQQAQYSDVRIWYQIDNLVANFGLRGDLLSRLASLADEVVFSIITHDPEQGPPDW